MKIQKLTFKWKDKSVHLNCNCIFRWKDKSVRLNGKAKVYAYMARQKCTYKLQHKIVRLYGKTKLYV